MVKRASCAFFAPLWTWCALVAQDPPRITGLVLDETGAPLAGAAVGGFVGSAFVDTAALLQAPPAQTGADGRFSLAGDPLQLTVVVVAAPRRQSVALQAWASVADGGLDLGAVVLVPGSQLIGRVRGEDGEPLAGARVRVESSITDLYSYQQRFLAGACSDAQGIFKVPGVPKSGLRVVVEADGRTAVSRLVAQESPLDLTLRQAAVVRGRVVGGDGAPMAGARVTCVTAERLRVQPATRSGEDGGFELLAPPVGRFCVEASESVAPYRRFRSALLHGGGDGVEVRPGSASADDEPLAVTVVDAATKQPIRAFRLAVSSVQADNAQIIVANSRTQLRDYADRAVIERRDPDAVGSLLVEAEGHGFAVVAVPKADAALVVELGAEAVLSGRVVDAATKKPLAGVAVRALPKGNSSGSGGRPETLGPVTDDEGRYTLRGLRPGDYGVQAHAKGRPASPVQEIALQAGADNHLDLTVPAELWLELEFGENASLPPGATLRLGSRRSSGNQQGFFQHTLGNQLPCAVVGHRARIGPVVPGTHQVTLFVPSRVRSATGTPIELGWFDPADGVHRVELPDLRRVVQRGRVDLSVGIPSERVAVLAWPALKENRQLSVLLRSPNAAGIDGAGRFALDLPAGDYCVQLADLATGIVFHTLADDVTATDQELVVTPDVHWFDVRCVPERDGDPVVLQSLQVTMIGARNGGYPVFLSGLSGSSRRAGGPIRFTGTLEAFADDPAVRWLVPAGDLEIAALQSFEMLRPMPGPVRRQAVATEAVAIDKPEQAVTLRIPAPPSDEELLRR